MRLRPKRGMPPYPITILDGALPSGIEIDSDKYRLEGIPAEPGFFPLRLQIQDALGATGIIDGEIFVRPAN